MKYKNNNDHITTASFNSRTAVQAVITKLNSEYAATFDLEQLAAEANLSRRQFTALFRILTGMSVTSYINKQRIESAKHQLLYHSNIQAIAEESGFQDVAYFYRIFKHLTGLTPKQYIQHNEQSLRICALDHVGHLLVLGAIPVAASAHSHYFLHKLSNEIPVIQHYPWSTDEIAKLKPDIIITSNERDIQLLSSIAPVYCSPNGMLQPLELLQQLGKLLERKQNADAWIKHYERKASYCKQRLHQAGIWEATASVIEIQSEQIYVFGNRYGRGAYNLYNGLGFSSPSGVANELLDQAPFKIITANDLLEHAGTHLFYIPLDQRNTASFMQTKQWGSLPAVLQNHTYCCSFDVMSSADPISLYEQLDIQTKMLIDRSASNN